MRFTAPLLPPEGFRGKKADIYEGGHRIPAILSWPGRYDKGTKCEEMVCLSDLYATFAELLGAAIPDDTAEDSISLVPALKGHGSVRHSVVHSSGNGSFSLRTKDWKLELCSDSGSGGVLGGENEPSCTKEIPYQLYHLKEDVGEKKNVAALYPGRCLEMAQELLNPKGSKAFIDRSHIFDTSRKYSVVYRHMGLFAGDHQEIDLWKIFAVPVIAPTDVVNKINYRIKYL